MNTDTPRTDEIVERYPKPADELMFLARQLERELSEANKSYKTTKDWAHRIEQHLNTLLDRCADHADGAPDATDLAKFCNEMIGLSNSVALGDVMTLRKERDSLRAEVEALRKDKERINWVETGPTGKKLKLIESAYYGRGAGFRNSIDAAMKGAA